MRAALFRGRVVSHHIASHRTHTAYTRRRRRRRRRATADTRRRDATRRCQRVVSHTPAVYTPTPTQLWELVVRRVRPVHHLATREARERLSLPPVDIREYARTRGWFSLSLSFPLLASREHRRTRHTLSASRYPNRPSRASAPRYPQSGVPIHSHTFSRSSRSSRRKERSSEPTDRPDLLAWRAGLVRTYVHARRNETRIKRKKESEIERERRFVSPCLLRRPPGRPESSRAEHAEAGLALRFKPRCILDSEQHP